MNYEEFLFSQLFMSYIENRQDIDLEYDLIFHEVLKHRELFLKSSFNVDTLSEYDCILNYLHSEYFNDEINKLKE